VLGLWFGGSSLENITKDCWVFPLFEKGFPEILVFLCMVILLVILVIAALVYGVVAFVYGSSTC
jgi:hypothetical protein